MDGREKTRMSHWQGGRGPASRSNRILCGELRTQGPLEIPLPQAAPQTIRWRGRGYLSLEKYLPNAENGLEKKEYRL